jgi:hypothetical protein
MSPATPMPGASAIDVTFDGVARHLRVARERQEPSPDPIAPLPV